MPTRGRRHFVRQAVHWFLTQTLPRRELIIVEDGEERAADLLPRHAGIELIRLESAHTIGQKRNIACEAARGELIVHWDDDDWSAPWRLSLQTSYLLENDAALCGLNRMYYLDSVSGRWWEYQYPRGPRLRPWLAGNTLCYRREVWRRHPFPDVMIGEDNAFLWSARRLKIVPLEDPRFFVGVIHSDNSSLKKLSGPRWHPITPPEALPTAEIERAFRDIPREGA